MLFTEFRKSAETQAGAGTLTFKGRGIRSQGVVKYVIDLSVGTFAGVTKIVVAAGGANIYNCTGAQLNATLQRMTRGNYFIPAAATRFSIPFYAMDLPANAANGRPARTPDEGMYRYNQQFPGKLEPQVEITFSGAATAVIGTVFTDEPGFLYPTFNSTGLGSPAGAGDNQTFDITNPGLVRGFTFPTVGLNRLRVDFASRQRFEWNRNLFIEDGQLESADLAVNLNPIFLKIHGPEEAAKTSQFNFDVGAAWPAGTEAAIYTVLPQP